MDRTSWIALIACFFLLMGYPAIINHFYPPQPKKAGVTETAPATGNITGTAATPASSGPAETSIEPRTSTTVATVETGIAPEQIQILKNSLVEAQFTNHGGAIKEVSLLKHTADHNTPLVLNLDGPQPVLNLEGWSDASIAGYELSESSDRSVTYTRTLPSGVRLIRHYTLGDGYDIQLDQTLDASSVASSTDLSPYRLFIGLATSQHFLSQDRNSIKIAWHTAAGSYTSQPLTSFSGSSFLGFSFGSGPKTFIESPANTPLQWAAVKTQFFALIVASETTPALGVVAEHLKLPELQLPDEALPEGIAAEMTMPAVQVAPGAQVTQKFVVYAGPKQDNILKGYSQNFKQVMEFGWMGILSSPLLMLMNAIHSVVPNYGWSIILMTILIKLVLWMPQSKANMSMKRMQTVSPLIKQVQDKYKEEPQKLNEEMLKVYRDYGVNPVGGCLPMLIQMPIFFGFYAMLLSSVELRHATFLWIHDLSMPDTIYRLNMGFALPFIGSSLTLNPMPLIMAGTMFWSMSITPQPQGVDNPAMKVMKFMPLIFLLFCYNFSSALSLYWTVQNLLSIVQMKVNMRQHPPTLEQLKAEVAAKAGKTAAAKKKKR
jgi:YidC/Oxa1 family membrane protein insertase